MSSKNQEHHWIDPYEKWWMIIGVLVLLGLLTAVTVAALAFGIQVPVPEKRVDPNVVTQAGPFSETGLRDMGNNKYAAYLIGRTWAWDPKEIRVPVGSTVTFYLTSVDVQHGFMLWNTNVNFMVLPGQVSKLSVTFDEAGEYPYICNEYCGIGHHTMAGKVIVE